MSTQAPPLGDCEALSLDALRDPPDDVLARAEHRSIRLLRYTAAATLAVTVLALVAALGIALALLAAQAGTSPGRSAERLEAPDAEEVGLPELPPVSPAESSPSAAPLRMGRALTGPLVTLLTVLVLSITVLVIAFVRSAFTLRSVAREPTADDHVPGRAPSDSAPSPLPGAELLRALSDALSTALKGLASPTR